MKVKFSIVKQIISGDIDDFLLNDNNFVNLLN